MAWDHSSSSERHEEGTRMNKWIGPFKIFGYAVVVLMVLAMLYAAFMSAKYWSGISV